MIRRPPRSTLDRSSAASDVYKRQRQLLANLLHLRELLLRLADRVHAESHERGRQLRAKVGAPGRYPVAHRVGGRAQREEGLRLVDRFEEVRQEALPIGLALEVLGIQK